jgi:hypothetical protein
VSAFVLLGLGVFSVRGDLFVPGDPENSKKPIISFSKAHGLFDEMIKSELVRSQQDLEVKYTREEAEMIRNRLWNEMQVVLLRHYRPEEKVSDGSGEKQSP